MIEQNRPVRHRTVHLPGRRPVVGCGAAAANAAHQRGAEGRKRPLSSRSHASVVLQAPISGWNSPAAVVQPRVDLRELDQVQVVRRPVVLGAVRQQDDPLRVQGGDRARDRG